MVTPLAPLKFQISYLISPAPKTLLYVWKSPQFLRRTEICAIFVYFLPKFDCHGNCLGYGKISDSIFNFADPENPSIRVKKSLFFPQN